VKLADFGLMKKIKFPVKGSDPKLCNSFVGTTAYMSPERLDREASGGFSYPCDVWSLGLTCLYMAIGEDPIKGEFWAALEQTK